MEDSGLADPFDDPLGFPNLLVFALGADLLDEPSAGIPKVKMVTVGAEDYVAIEYRRRKIATDIAYVVEISTDLTAWEESSIQVAIVDNEDGTEAVTIRSDSAVPGLERQYLRLRVSVIQ